MAVGLVVEHAGLSAASDCAMVRKERVMNGIWGLRTKEDSSEVRQVGSLEDYQRKGGRWHLSYRIRN